jgi:DNA-binding transcriptional MocR family regulator
MEALREGVAFVTGEAFYLSGGDQEMRLCFSTVAPEQIELGVKRLAAAAKRVQEARPDESQLVTMPVV